MVPSLGHKVPEFVLPDSEKTNRSLGDFTRDGNVMLAFFPFAFSGTCDKEMCAFRDELSPLHEAGAQVVGISVDSVYTLKALAQTYALPFPLLSDFNKRVSRLYGVLEESWESFGYKGVSKRSIFLVDQKGILRYRWIGDVPSREPPYDEAIEASKKWVV